MGAPAMTETNRPLKVFLCHSSNDKPAVRELYKKLRTEPWNQPWLDEEELYPGDDWDLAIEKAVEAANAIIVCLSKGSITKEGYVQKEIKTALDFSDYKPEGTVFIIPIRLEECEPPKRLSKWQYADYFEGQRERAFQRLVVSLKRRADSLGLKFEEPAPKKEEKPFEEKKHVIELPITKKESKPEPVAQKKPVVETTKLVSAVTPPVSRVANPTNVYFRLLGIGGIVLLALICGALGLNYLIRNLPVATATIATQNLPFAIATATLQMDPVKISSVVSAGTLNSEIVVVNYEGEGQLDFDSWQLKDENGNTFTFPKLILYPNGAVRVHTVAGTDTVIDLYWGLDSAVWNSGETARLYDSQGLLRAVYQVP
jgi:hypothetical protein